ncbi:MAG: polysaccharide deacetylase family protein [Bacteroidetes bacterium]|nr:polysaccharide deacetylase family protein [Bacteroidota bacterium]
MVFNKRNIAAYLLSRYLMLTGKVKQIKNRADKGEFILSVYFHDPDKKLFESCVRWFLNNGFSFISTNDLEAIAKKEKPFPKASVLFTVDDGWKGNKENIAEVANRYKIPVTIFASTQPIATGEAYWWSYIAEANKKGLVSQSVSELKKVANEERVKIVQAVRAKVPIQREALTVDELKEISADGLVSIESHTVTHPILITCSDEQSRFEILESKTILETWLQKKVKHFAYPNGLFTNREIKFLQEAGYTSAYTTVPEYITAESFRDMYRLPRFDVLETVSFAENICRMTGAWFDKPSLSAKG